MYDDFSYRTTPYCSVLLLLLKFPERFRALALAPARYLYCIIFTLP